MLEFVIGVVTFTFGISVGWKLREMHAQNVVKKYMQEQAAQTKIDPASIMNVTVEKHGEQYYIYDAKSNKFLVQVTTKEQLMDFFTEKYPDKTILMTQEHLQMIENS